MNNELLEKYLTKMSYRDRNIIELRCGLISGKERTQKEVADMLGISQSYLRRIEANLIKTIGISIEDIRDIYKKDIYINKLNVLDNAIEWINKVPNEIEEYLKEDKNLLGCIEVFYILTRFYRLNYFEQNINIWQNFQERREEILLKFINKIFSNVSDEVASNIITKWYEKVNKDSDYISSLFARLPSKEISDNVKLMFLQIDDRFILGANDLLQEFCKNKIAQGIKKEKIQDLSNINNAKIVILSENSELLIYTLKNNLEKKISFDKIIDCNYTKKRSLIFSTTLTISTEDSKFPELVVNSYDKNDTKLYELYKEIINKINNSEDIISNQTIEYRLRQLKKLLEEDLITELEYKEKRKQIIEKL